MSIRSIGNSYGPLRPAAPAPTAPATPGEPAVAAKRGGPPAHAPAHGYRARHDTVALSDSGRALAGADALGSSPASALTPERVADLRKKVLEGAYNQTGVVDQVAKRLLASGEV